MSCQLQSRWRKANGTRFVNFEPQCASMRAEFAIDYLLSCPHASALRLKVSAIGRNANGNDCICKSCVLAINEKCRKSLQLQVKPALFWNPASWLITKSTKFAASEVESCSSLVSSMAATILGAVSSFVGAASDASSKELLSND